MDLKLLKLFESFIRKYTKPSIFLLEDFFEKDQVFNTISLFLYSYLCKLTCMIMTFKSISKLVFQNYVECGFQLLFYKLLFYFITLGRIGLQPYFYDFMQTKPFGLIETSYLKPCLVSENMSDAGLKSFCGFYRILDINLTLFGFNLKSV
jgi:hypothetical protein